MTEWYKEWYDATAAGEQSMQSALQDPDTGAAVRADIQRRLDEMEALSDERCSISLDQRRFLKRVLSE